MSKQIDERVVSMQFDNKHFESNVSTTMSTLDKLKQKLNFKGASDGLNDVSASAKKVDMSGLANGVETVRAKFSALDVIGVTALANITNSAVNAGKKIVSALTIDPIKTGFQEYETQINAVQTILANTESKGSTIDDVNKALEELNKYADMTIYNFTEMTRNIGTFTAAGVDLETSTNAIKGIANLAAVSGSTSQQASTAMYQLSQALASGTVKLMDWNSVVNAGMGGQVFQDALKETARIHGVAIDEMIEKEGSFRETLSSGWLTSEILTDTLEKFTMYAEEGTEQWDEYMEALKDKGYTEEQAREILKLGKSATEAATKVKTFTQLWDVLKEAAQSGWSQSWKIIVGDFEEAKAFLSPLADAFTNIINKMSDWRNAILESAFGRTFGKMVEGIMKPLDGVADVVETVSGALVDYDKLVDEIIMGKWGNAPTRWQDLADAGYDWAYAQNLVNERLGDSTRHATDYVEGQEKVSTSTKKSTKALNEWTDAEYESLEALIAMSDAELRAAGYTEEQISALRELEALAKKLGFTVTDLLKNIDKIDGRALLFDAEFGAFTMLGKTITTVCKAISDAWKSTFTSITKENIADALFEGIAAFRRFSVNILASVEANADKIQRTFRGLFSILKIVGTLVGGPLKIAFKLLSSILGALDLNIWDVTAVIGDAIVKFESWLSSILNFEGIAEGIVSVVKNARDAIRDWAEETEFFTKIFGAIKGVITDAADSVRNWIDGLKDAKDLPKAIADGIVNAFKKIPYYFNIVKEAIQSAFSGAFSGISFELDPNSFLGKFVNRLKIAGQVIAELGKMLLEKINGVLTAHGFQEISLDMIQGLVNGLKDGASKAWAAIVELGKQLIEKVKEVLGIHSPSTVFFAIGGFIIAGLIGGLLAGSGDLKGAMQTLGTKLGEFFEEVDFKSIFSAVLSAGLMKAVMDVASAIKSGGGVLDGIADMFDGIGDILQNASKVVKSFSKYLKAAAFEKSMNGLKSMAIAFAIVVGAVVVLTFVDQTKLKEALKCAGIIAGILVAMFGLMSLINKISGGNIASTVANAASLSGVLVGLGLSLILMAAALKILSGVDFENTQAFDGLEACVVSILAVLAVCAIIAQGPASKNVKQVGGVLIKLAVTLLLMTLVIKALGGMDPDVLKQGLKTLALVMAMVAAIMLIAKIPTKGEMNALAGTLLAMAVAIGVMATVVATLGKLERDVLIKGMAAMGTLVVAMALIMGMTWLATDKDMMYLSGVLLSMSVAIGIMALVVAKMGTLEKDVLIKGMAALGTLLVAIAGLVLITKLTTEKEMIGLAGTLIAMSIAIGVLGVVVALLGLLSEDHLNRGLTAVTILGLIMSVMIASTYGAKQCKGNIIAMTVAIALMAVAVVALSFIPWESLAPAVAGLSVLLGMFALLIKTAGTVQGSLPVLITMTVAMTLLGVLLYLLAQLPVENVIGSAIALSVLLGVVSGVLLLLSKMNMDAGDALVGILALTLMAIPLRLFVGVLAAMEGLQNASTNVAALSQLLAVSSVMLMLLTVVGSFAIEALAGVLALTALAIPLRLFVWVLGTMENLENATTNANALMRLTSVLSLLLIPLTLVGVFAPMALVGVLALTAMAIPLRIFVGILALMENLQNATANVDIIVNLMTRMTLLMALLAPLAPLALIAVVAVTALIGLIGAVGLLATGVGALMEKFPDLESFLDKGIPILEKLAYAIGSLAGNLISGFVETVAGSLPVLGKALSDFMIYATPFIVGIKMVDASMLEGIGVLTAAILLLTAADLVNGIGTFLGGGSNFSDLGTELANFMTNAQPFIEGMKGVDPASFTAVGALADAIVKLTAANVLEGLTSWFAGETSLAAFGEDLAAFGPSMKTYADAVAGIDTEAVKVSAEAAKTLADMANSLPNEGGLMGKIFGENNMDTFGTQLAALGSSLKTYSDAVVGIDTEAIDTSVTAAKSLADMANAIPNEGGLLGLFAGENSMDTFGSQLESFGASLKAYSDSVIGIDTEAVSTSVTAATDLVGMADAIPNEGGLLSVFSGDNSMETFGANLESFGSSLTAYASAVTGLDTEAVTNSVTAGKELAGLADAIPESGIFVPDDLANFADDIEPFGAALKAYSDSVAGVSTTNVENSVTAAKKVVGLVKDLSGLDSGDAKEFKKALEHLGESSVDDFVDAFDNSISDLENIGGKMMKAVADGAKDKASKVATAAKEAAEDAAEKAESKDNKFKSAGKKLVEAFADGIEAKSSTAERAMKSVAKAAADSSDDKKSSFTSAGKDMVSGFASGITTNTFKAEAAAKAMASAALKAAKEKLKINSPSKVFMALAASIPEGFAMGIDKFQNMVVNSASDMATTAVDSVKRSISSLGNMVSSDIETQPTIRPVLDLSDVKSNASKIGSLLGFDHSVGVMANIGSISSMMNNQNGVNDDVIAAINKLSKGLDNVGNTTYSINGITYDDGSNIADAMRTITRAAKMGRRV